LWVTIEDAIPAADLFAQGNFYRVAVPKDIQEGIPDPANWGNPTATLEAAGCDIPKYFKNHSIIFGTSRLFLASW